MKKTSIEWLGEIQTRTHLKIDLNNFNHLFNNEKITLDEFEYRLLNSIVECNFKEMNDWLNNQEQKS